MEGYIILQRKFFTGQFWEEKRVFSKAEAWIDLVTEARFEKEPKTTFIKGKSITWKRGELPISLRFLGNRWGWNKNKVDRFLDFLVNDGAIKIGTHSGTQQSIITLCNYDSYNQLKPNSGTLNQTPTGHQRDKTNKGNNISKDIDTEILNGIIETVVEYLNKKTGRTFDTKTEETRKLITARVKEKRVVKDFFAVIDIKFSQWGSDPKMKLFLQPSTLFSGKFSRYLEESEAKIIGLNPEPKKPHHFLSVAN